MNYNDDIENLWKSKAEDMSVFAESYKKSWEMECKRRLDTEEENKRLKEEVEKYTTNFARVAKLIKSEAYHEFAERLKCGVPQETGVIRCKDVDFTLAELTERKEDKE